METLNYTSHVAVVDIVAPITEFHDDRLLDKPNPFIKRKLNIRNRLLKHLKKRPTMDLKIRIKHLNIEIKNYFYGLVLVPRVPKVE